MAEMCCIEKLKRSFHDPHRVLGIHGKEKNSIRLFRPGALQIHLEVQGFIHEAVRVDEIGLFEWNGKLPLKSGDYKIYHSSGLLAEDPYAFSPATGELDLFLFNKGTHYKIYEVLGAHRMCHEGVNGIKFAVWAPEAIQVALVADFNQWDGRVNPMRKLAHSGIWELFVPGIQEGEKYKFEVRTQSGDIQLKTDPYAHAYELRPQTASIVTHCDERKWSDCKWMQTRKETVWGLSPINIYEVHLGSWKRTQNHFMNYRELAHELSFYCQEMGFTHIELLPIEEHPLDESWGYQVTGFFAPTSRYGSLEDFQYFVNYLHEKGIGIILDWVPAHFPRDEFSLAKFDGSYLYEHLDPKQALHPHWNTLIFNYGRHEVSCFLLGSALFWLEKMHIDGLRVDAVASMLYLDYGREEGGWIPNRYGGNHNLEAIEFLKHLNAIIHERVEGVLMCAEESSAFQGVTHSLIEGGLGFDLKWNMGWMNDTLRYMQTDSFFRHYHHEQLTFGLLYAFSEKFLLPLSHDEVVHGKRSLLSKMPGDEWQKFAGLRLLLGYHICQPGKKLFFMGGELGMREEWDVHKELPWHLLQEKAHKELHKLAKDLNHLYLIQEELHELDVDGPGFSWVNCNDRMNSVIAYFRKSSRKTILCVHNFTPSFFPSYEIHIAHLKAARELLNTDHTEYGGSHKINSSPLVKRDVLEIQLAPLATMIFSLEWDRC